MINSMTWKLQSLAPIPLVFLLLLSLGTPASAKSVEEQWFQKLDAAERNLRAQKWDAAYRKAEKVSRDVMRRLVGGTGAEELLARIFVIQAVAEAGRGNERLAHWNWDAALELHPAMEKLQLDAYGEAGRMLRTDPRKCERKCEKEDSSDENLENVPTADIEPPRKTFAPKPDFPLGRWTKRETGIVILQTVISEDGHLWQPNVLKDDDEPLMAFATLRAMRDWTFEPAKLEGEPVDVYYNISLSFGVQEKKEHGEE